MKILGIIRTAESVLPIDPSAKKTVVADLDQDISATYVEAEVQAISDKVDELQAALREAGVIK